MSDRLKISFLAAAALAFASAGVGLITAAMQPEENTASGIVSSCNAQLKKTISTMRERALATQGPEASETVTLNDVFQGLNDRGHKISFQTSQGLAQFVGANGILPDIAKACEIFSVNRLLDMPARNPGLGDRQVRKITLYRAPSVSSSQLALGGGN